MNETDAIKIIHQHKKEKSTHTLIQYNENIFEIIIPFIDEASLQNALTCITVLLFLKN